MTSANYPVFRMTDDEDQRAHYVYRLYDRADRLLYVGCTVDPEYRVEVHHRGLYATSPARWTCWRYPNKRTARAAEVEAIAAEQPLHNKQHKRALAHSP